MRSKIKKDVWLNDSFGKQYKLLKGSDIIITGQGIGVSSGMIAIEIDIDGKIITFWGAAIDLVVE